MTKAAHAPVPKQVQMQVPDLLLLWMETCLKMKNKTGKGDPTVPLARAEDY
jgi:hypothetical protein